MERNPRTCTHPPPPPKKKGRRNEGGRDASRREEGTKMSIFDCKWPK